MQTFLWTMGGDDAVSITEAPDDETMVALMAQIGSQGNVRTETLRAFDAEEMGRVLQKFS